MKTSGTAQVTETAAKPSATNGAVTANRGVVANEQPASNNVSPASVNPTAQNETTKQRKNSQHNQKAVQQRNDQSRTLTRAAGVIGGGILIAASAAISYAIRHLKK